MSSYDSQFTTLEDNEDTQMSKRSRSGNSAMAAVSRPSAKEVNRTINRKKAQSLKTAIAKVVSGMAEKKIATISDGIALSSAFTPGYLAFASGIRCISPYSSALAFNIGTGSQVNQRTGNKIRPTKCTMKYVISPNVYSAGNNPQPQPVIVRLWIFKPKDQSTFSPSVSGFFQNGASSSNFSGNLQDIVRSVNTESYTLLATKTWKIGMALSEYASITYGGFANYANNDYKMNAIGELDVTKYLAKVYTYDDSDNTPTNVPTYMVWEAVNADGSSMVSGGYPVTVTYTLQMNYVDF